MKKLLILFFIFYSLMGNAQTVYEHISNERLYGFIDELAALQLIDVTTAIKPYSRTAIAAYLVTAREQQEALSRAQQALLDTYLNEYAHEAGNLKTGHGQLFSMPGTMSIHAFPPEIAWRDSLFRTLIRPIFGIRYFSSTNKDFYHSYFGAEVMAYAGKRWGAYASLRDNYQSSEPLAMPGYFTREEGGSYKIGVQGRSGADYSEMRGGITYSWNWGSLAFIKDHLQWGDNVAGSNIFSGRTPSFPMIKLHLKPAKWLEFDYFHGWLISEVIDSSRSYVTGNGDFRAVFRNKYIAANMYTFIPLKHLHISVGNSIVYSDVPVQPAYLIPFFFFKSIDHTLNKDIENQNSAMFLNLSSRQIKHIHLYASVFIDEFSVSRIGNPQRHNFTSLKGGFALSGWPLKGLYLATEFTHTNPITYKHRVPSTTFESNQFNLGHYLRDNSREIFLAIRYPLWRTLQMRISYTNAIHGNEYKYILGTPPIDELPVLAEKSWSAQTISLRAEMLPLPNVRVFAEYALSDVKGYAIDGKPETYYLDRFSPQYLHGKTNTLVLGFGMGF